MSPHEKTLRQPRGTAHAGAGTSAASASVSAAPASTATSRPRRRPRRRCRRQYTDKPNSYGKYQGTSSNHPQVVRSIVDQLKQRSRETVDGFEGMKTVDAIEKIYRSVKQHQHATTYHL
ncbi:MAG: hypothetical protein AAF399_26910 [Bacteroidota bacterium]